MIKYRVTVRTNHGTTHVIVEARNPAQAKDIASAYGQVLSVNPA